MRTPRRPTRRQSLAAMFVGMAWAVYYAWQQGWFYK